MNHDPSPSRAEPTGPADGGPSPLTRSLELPDEAATDALAASLAQALTGGWQIHLSGDLGAGKTRFVRGLLRALGHTGRVRSPTFTLMEPYKLANFTLYHFDFYRFSGENDWRDAGFDEWLADERGVVVIEWPEMAGRLPTPDLQMQFEFGAGESRRVQLRSQTSRGSTWLTRIATTHPQAAPGFGSAQPPEAGGEP